MQKLYDAADRIEAQLIKDFLLGRGIETVILGDFLAGAAGELPANLTPTVWVVDDADLPRATALTGQLRRGLPAGEDRAGWTCPRCGESLEGQFDCCWRCATPRPEG